MITATKRSTVSICREDVPLTDAEIIKKYIGIDKFPCVLCSPLREDDDRPSFSMMKKGDAIIWKDFGTGKKGNAVTLMSELWHTDYKETLLKLKLDCQNLISRIGLVHLYKGPLHMTSSSEIKVRIREWKQWDIDYWKSYGISKDFATWCDVYPISHAFFTKEIDGAKKTVIIPMEKYAYAYFEWKDGKQSIKLYQPYSKTIKWLSKHDSSVWDLWKQAFLYKKHNDNAIIITSSRKDAMCLWENLNVPAIAMQGEGYLPKPQVMQELLSSFKKVYIWYDNDFTHLHDNPGQDNAKKIIDLYPSIKNICIPEEYRCKDPSDLVKNRGVFRLLEVWNSQK